MATLVQSAVWQQSMASEPVRAAPTTAERDAARFRRLFDDHYDFIWRLLGRLGVAPAAVDDAAQEVFIVAARRLTDVRPGSERAFLFGIARRHASDLRRSEQRRGEVGSDEFFEFAHDGGTGPDAAIDARRLLDIALSSMGDDTREVFVLFELEGLTKPEVAKLLGIPEGTAASRLRRAREEFMQAAARLESRLKTSAGDVKP